MIRDCGMRLDERVGGKDVAYSITRYPDGQLGAEIDRNLHGVDVVIRVRMNSFDCVHALAVVVSALRAANAGDIYLSSPYFLGGRSDRRFSENGSYYLGDVICPIINAMGFREVHILDPHSVVLPSLLERVVVDDVGQFYRWASEFVGECDVVCPDAGAVSRTERYAEVANSRRVVYCSKIRDVATGKIISTSIPVSGFDGRDVVIVDDICDGGATFLNLGRQIRELKCGRLYLVVTHGIFSAGFHLLEGVFDKIVCTDSYASTNSHLVNQFIL